MTPTVIQKILIDLLDKSGHSITGLAQEMDLSRQYIYMLYKVRLKVEKMQLRTVHKLLKICAKYHVDASGLIQ